MSKRRSDANRQATELTRLACVALTKRGDECRMPRVHGSEWCFQHDPALANQRQVARTLGGRHSKRLELPVGEPSSLRTISECLTELERLADDARRLHHGEGRIRALTAIIRTALDAHRDHTLEKRLDELEARLAANPTPALRRA